MKIHQIPIGTRFEFDGEEYTKTGPMLATAKSGGQRLIPKYADLVIPSQGEELPAKKAPPVAANTRTLAAFRAFCDGVRPLVPESAQGEFEAARKRFLAAIGARSEV